MTFVNDIKNWWRYWSIQLSFVSAIWFVFSEQITAWWNLHATEYLPFLSDFQAKWIGLILIVATAVTRLIKQGKLNAPNK